MSDSSSATSASQVDPRERPLPADICTCGHTKEIHYASREAPGVCGIYNCACMVYEPVVAPLAREPLDPGAILRAAAQTFEERNAAYGDAYKKSGAIVALLCPGGVKLETAEDFSRFGVFMHCVNKLMRYGHALPSGGHQDSARDLAAYAAMLESLTK
jgi:hypothetical protein